MAGSGTTAVECKLLGRRAVAVDINPDAVMVARNRLDFVYTPLDADYQWQDIKNHRVHRGYRDKTTRLCELCVLCG